MYGYLKQSEHLFARGLSYHVLGHKFILQSVIYQVVGTDAAIYQALHFVNHSLIDASLQALGDAASAVFHVYVYAYHKGIIDGMRLCCHLEMWILLIVGLNLYSADSAFAVIHIGAVVQGLHLAQDGCQFVESFVLQALSQLRILRHLRQFYALEHALHIKTCAATQNHILPATANIGVCLTVVAKILVEIIFITGIANVDKMIWHAIVVGKVFAGSEVHSSIYLSRIGADDFGVDGFSQCHCLRGLSRGCGAGYYI